MARLLISAAHKSSGKTTLTLGICAALTARGLKIQAFKKGPDYIDPLWLSQASRRPCYNLDFYITSPQEIIHEVQRHPADLSIIEGNHGLYDGMDVEGNDSNAALAKLLNTPVILVLDTQGMARGIVPLIVGYQAFDSEVSIVGIILNKVAGSRHEGKLRTAVERYTTIPIVGAVQRDSHLEIAERHLGLMPSNEHHGAQVKIDTIAQSVAEQIDLNQLLTIAQHGSPADWLSVSEPKISDNSVPDVTIGIIRDAAFGFYYPGDLVALEMAGAHLVFIDALGDSYLPPLDGLFIGGGFPETQMEKLADNHTLKHAIYDAVEQGLPVYAECGGLMYLARQLIWQEKRCEMVGILPFDTIMENRPQGRGYVQLQETGHGLWPLKDVQGHLATFPAHEFHYSKAIQLPPNLTFAYKVLRGQGLDGQHDGVVYKNTLACYVHLRDVGNNRWTRRFVNFVQNCKYQSKTFKR